jgi:hypothetical protein
MTNDFFADMLLFAFFGSAVGTFLTWRIMDRFAQEMYLEGRRRGRAESTIAKPEPVERDL